MNTLIERMPWVHWHYVCETEPGQVLPELIGTKELNCAHPSQHDGAVLCKRGMRATTCVLLNLVKGKYARHL